MRCPWVPTRSSASSTTGSAASPPPRTSFPSAASSAGRGRSTGSSRASPPGSSLPLVHRLACFVPHLLAILCSSRTALASAIGYAVTLRRALGLRRPHLRSLHSLSRHRPRLRHRAWPLHRLRHPHPAHLPPARSMTILHQPLRPVHPASASLVCLIAVAVNGVGWPVQRARTHPHLSKHRSPASATSIVRQRSSPSPSSPAS